MTANYCAIYRLNHKAVNQIDVDRTTWLITYGKVIYNAEKDIWQADVIYALKAFTDDPTNTDLIVQQSESWISESGYWQWLQENGNGL